MAENLFLDKEGATGVVNQVINAIGSLKEAAAKIDSCIMSDMPNYWRGASHQRTEQTYLADYQNFLTTKVPDMVEQLQKYMSDCVQAITDVDNQLAGS